MHIDQTGSVNHELTPTSAQLASATAVLRTLGDDGAGSVAVADLPRLATAKRTLARAAVFGISVDTPSKAVTPTC